MAVGAPPGQRVEVEFTPGVWTDVTADVETLSQGPVQTHFGRTSQFAQPGPASTTIVLRNKLGRYTPRRQVLADGVTAHPYWPDVQPRKRVRRSWTVGATTYVRYLGYITGWPPSLESGVPDLPIVTVPATTRENQLSRVKLKSPILQGMADTSPAVLFPLTDAAGATQALQFPDASATPLKIRGISPLLTFGEAGPGVGDGTGVKFAPASSAAGQFLTANLPQNLDLTAYTIECYVNAGTSLPAWASGSGTESILGFNDALLNWGFIFYLFGGVPSVQDQGGSANGSTSIADGKWHHLAATRSSAGGNITLWVDGAVAATQVGSTAATTLTSGVLCVGDSLTAAPARFQGSIGYVAVHTLVLASDTIATHAAARNGFAGDTTDQRIARWLDSAGVFSAARTLDTGQAAVGSYPQDGKDVLAACQDMAATEGGGAVFYIAPSGTARFINRRYRDNRTPVLTLDASIPALLDPAAYTPAFDESTLVNQVPVSRQDGTGELSAQTATDTESVDLYGASTGDGVTSYATTDQDALNLAQYVVAGNATPAFRLDQLTVNFHAAPVSLYAALAAVEIGSRIRVTNLPASVSPVPTVDLFVEGWTETVTPAICVVVFDTSPADAPRRFKANTSKVQCDGQTLNANLAVGAGSLAIATAGGKATFTTTGGAYPLDIQIGEEQIRLNTAPGGSTSPQTFSSITRGVNGTTRAQQLAGATVTLAARDAAAL